MNVLVTGGTGHLGGELLVVLSQLAHVERVFCLVRPKHGVEARARLARVFELHGDTFDPNQVRPVEGDLLDADLGRGLARQEGLSQVEVIIHCAADTSFSPFQSRSVHRTNVEGLARFLGWAAGLPRLRTFLYVGTAGYRRHRLRRGVPRRVALRRAPP